MRTVPQPRTSLARRARLAAFEAGSRMGLPSLLLQSAWRTRRLLILGYHGISLEDEHEWRPALYIPPALFRSRLEALRGLECAVLPLGEALRRLYSGSLPPRAVAITFDDGSYDFYSVALPLIREFGFPATVYLTSYYSGFNRPVFDVMLSYLFWRARGMQFAWPGVLASPVHLDARGAFSAERAIREHAHRSGLDGAAKDRLLADLAERLGQDYTALCARRILHLMNASEIGQAAAEGIDFQLHTHRHRLPRARERFIQEIEDNRSYIAGATGASPVHFCYPSGVAKPELAPVLREAGVNSAVTCVPGLATPASDPLFLPRVLDVSSLSGAEFEAWVSGFAEFVPRRRLRISRISEPPSDTGHGQVTEPSPRAAQSGPAMPL